MMFSRALTLVALPLLAVATAIQGRGGEPSSGDACCQSTSTASDPATADLLTSLGISVQDVTGLVGVNCSPITVIGVGSSGCSGTTVTCTDTSHGGVVDLGCVPVTA